MKDQRVDTVDQELFHIVNAINSSPDSGRVRFFAGQIVTDNVSSNAHETDVSLQHAEATILATAEIRKEFFSKTLEALGIEQPIGSKPSRCQSLKERTSVLANKSMRRTLAIPGPSRRRRVRDDMHCPLGR